MILFRLCLLGLLLAAGVNAFVPTYDSFQSRRGSLQLAAVTDTCDVVVFGGGFGGLYTALAIAREDKQQRQRQRRGKKQKPLDIVLVEPSESFVFLPLLYDLTVGTATEAEVCPAYQELLEGSGVRHVRASLDSMDQQSASAILKPASPQDPSELTYSSAVVAVGASPQSMLASIPGALDYVQPFYTAEDAKRTRRLLARLEEEQQKGQPSPRIAIVGGGFGGVELAASVQRKLPQASVTLLSRGAPMAGTRAEPLIQKALQKLGVVVEECSVEAITEVVKKEDTSEGGTQKQRVVVERTPWGDNDESSPSNPIDTLEAWDVVLWTAGSAPAQPVADGLEGLRKSDSGRLAMDSSLRCFACEELQMTGESPEDVRTVKRVIMEQPAVWALGDCAEIVSLSDRPAVPKTAQAAMQQADVVAFNLLAQLEASTSNVKAPSKQFQYQDLGSMLTLGGPNAALLSPADGAFAPIFTPILDTVGEALGFADKLLEATAGRSPVVEKFGLSPETLGLSLGSYGLGVESGGAPGTLAGTLTGAARRAVYAARMPTNRQRAVAGTSAAISTAAALAKEIATRNQQE